MLTTDISVQEREATRNTVLSFAPWPFFAEDEIEAAASILRSGKVNYWTGEQGRTFERKFAEFAGCEYAVAVANGTVALELALYALGIGDGDEVITTSRTFIASASCAVARGARPVMADVDADSQNITAETVQAMITPRTKAIIAVHLAGWPCDMDPLLALAEQHGIAVIEDCAQAHGASYKGRPVGSMGVIGAFSFCQDKIMTTAGEGGMVTTNDPTLWKRMWGYKDHGKSYDQVYHRAHAPGFRWLHQEFGTNWRLTEVQSAIGLLALAKLPTWLTLRQRNAGILNEHLQGLPALRIPVPPPDVQHAWYKYYAFVRPERLKRGWNRDRILEELTAKGIPCSVGSCSEIYLERAFPDDLQPLQRLPVARELGERSLMLLVHPTLSQDEMHTVGAAVAATVSQATL